MDPSLTKPELLSIIDSERGWWDALVARIPLEARDEGVVEGNWTFRDVAAHLLAWREWGLARLEADAANRPEPVAPVPESVGDDVDQINAWFHEHYRDQTAEDVIAAFSSSFNRLGAVVEQLSEEALADPARFPNLEGASLSSSLADRTFFDHLHVEHGPSLERFVATAEGR